MEHYAGVSLWLIVCLIFLKRSLKNETAVDGGTECIYNLNKGTLMIAQSIERMSR